MSTHDCCESCRARVARRAQRWEDLKLVLVIAVSIALPCLGVAADLCGWLIP